MINVKDPPYGATGDGTTNDTAAVASAVNAALAQGGGEIFFPRGTYNLATWTTPALNQPIRLRGEVPGGVVLRGPGTLSQLHKFALIRGELDVNGLEFENWQTVLDGAGSGSVRGVSVIGCRVRNSAYFLTWMAATGDFVRQLVIDRCAFESLTASVVIGNVNRDAVYFTRSSAVDCQRHVLRMSAVPGPGGTEPAGPGLVVFSENYVRNLNAELFNSSFAEARVVQVSCERLVVTDNHVKGVRSKVGGSNANFTYTSSLYAYVEGNYLEDIGEPGDPNGGPIIHEKNSEAIAGRYLNNHFVQNPPVGNEPPLRSAAIVVQHRGHTVVQGNEARGLHNSLLLATYNPDNIVVANNVVRDENSPYGTICIYGGRNVVIESNVIDGVQDTYSAETGLSANYFARGIRIERYAQAVTVDGQTTVTLHAPQNVRIANNVIHGVKHLQAGVNNGSGVYVYATGSGVNVRGLSIVGNTITDCDKGVELRADAPVNFTDAEISFNTFRGNRVNVHAPVVPTSFTTRGNRGYVTEAAGTATLAPPATTVQVAHGLARTPSLSAIQVTPQDPMTPASCFWISGVTATDFTIHLDVAPTAAVDFGWTAQVL